MVKTTIHHTPELGCRALEQYLICGARMCDCFMGAEGERVFTCVACGNTRPLAGVPDDYY